MARPASSAEEIDGSKMPPLLLHFDVNKTLIIADSIMNKSTEYTIREVIAKQFWGFEEERTDENGETRKVWKWDGRGPSMSPPAVRGTMSRNSSRRPSTSSNRVQGSGDENSSPRPMVVRRMSTENEDDVCAVDSLRQLSVRRVGTEEESTVSMVSETRQSHRRGDDEGAGDLNELLLRPPPVRRTGTDGSGCTDASGEPGTGASPRKGEHSSPQKTQTTPRKSPNQSPVPATKRKSQVAKKPINYLKFLRDNVQDQSAIRLATRSFELVSDTECKQKMHSLAEQASANMAIPQKLRTERLQRETGLVGEWKLTFPSFFRLIAQLQREGRHFAVSFRSFGTDLNRVGAEWNSFCEGRHPLLEEFCEGLPKMDGTVEGVPDRRLAEDSSHTIYRDAEGPVLVIGTITNGNWEGEWDQWARSGSQVDTRGGRAFMREQGLEVVKGYTGLQTWWKEQLMQSKTSLIREDFAWWHHSGEVTTAGKLLIGISDVQQVFFDDNIGDTECRIVDPRFATTFLPVPPMNCLGYACVQVDTLQAMLNDSYFIDAFYAADVCPETLWTDDEVEGQATDRPSGDVKTKPPGKARRMSVDGPAFLAPVTSQSSKNSVPVLAWRHNDESKAPGEEKEEEECAETENEHEKGEIENDDSVFGDEGSDNDLGEDPDNENDAGKERPLHVTDLDALRELLSCSGVDVGKFGAGGTTYKTVENLHQELTEKKCVLKRAEGEVRVQRVMQVVRVKLMCNNLILVETHEQLPDGRFRSRNGYLPATKKRHGETLRDTIERWAVEELQISVTQEQKEEAVKSCQHKYEFTSETMSYPLPCKTHYLEVCCRLDPEQTPKSLLDRLGLPSGSMFSTRGMKKKKRSSTNEAGSLRFWCWYRAEVWEAMTLNEDVELPDVQACMEELFQGHARRDAYSSLLLQMFDCFSASRLCGGLSGSLVLQVQPVDPIEGKNEEAVIVKLDKADVISREIANSKRVWNVLSDRAARIFGQGCFYTDNTSVEYGAFKIELAGGCWQVPELAGGNRTKDLLMTFKDLLAVESARQLLDTDMHHLVSTSGDVEAVLFELLGPGGMLRVLRREPLARSTHNLFGSFVYAGKDTKWNPLFTPNHFQLEPMKELWKRSFGNRGAAVDMPDVREKVQDLMRRFTELEGTPLGRYKPITGLAHGDLNAMNVLIDVMDAVWLIDFAFSEEKPLCWDLAKLEVAFMFEYAVLPVSWLTLLDFAGDNEEVWKARKVHTWLGVSEPVAYALLEELVRMKVQLAEMRAKEKVAEDESAKACEGSKALRRSRTMNNTAPTRRLPKRRGARMEPEYALLQKAILRAVECCYQEQPLDRSKEKKRDTELCRLCALLVATQAEEEAALEQAAAVAQTMLSGDSLQTVMEPAAVKLQRDEGASLLFCWSKAARLRLFFKEEWLELRRRAERELGPLYSADESPLVHWLGLLQESHRLLGYFDVAPWVKVFAVFFLEGLVARIDQELNKAESALGRLHLRARRTSKANLILVPPRPYPTDLDIALRLLAQRGGTPSSHTSRRRIRSTYAKSPELHTEGGLFAEVRSLASATVGDTPMCAELVRSYGADLGLAQSHCEEVDEEEVSKGVDMGFHIGSREVKVGVLILPPKDDEEETPARFILQVPLVPLGEKNLNQQDRRRGVRATGETEDGQQIAVTLAVTETAYCYPPGQRLSVTPNNIAPLLPGMRLQFATVSEFNERTGNYSVAYDNQQKNAFEDMEIDPFEGNHLVASSCFYSEATRLSVLSRESGGGFIEVTVEKRPPKEGSVRHILSLENAPAPDGEKQAIQLDLNDFNHAHRVERVGREVNTEEEVRKYRVFAKAKHSFIYTVTSERADVLEGPVPRLADEAGREAFFWSEVQAMIAEDDDRASGHIFFQGIIIIGEAGSGKSSLLCKLAMHCLSTSTLLVPVLVPVLDVCSRLQKAEESMNKDELSEYEAEGLMEWYLRMVYGFDTNRFIVLRQAMESHRILFLFDGLDEAGPYTARIERCITGMVACNHRVVATARMHDDHAEEQESPRRSARVASHLHPRWLKTAPQLFRVFELLPLELECRRSLVEVLLAREQTMSTDGVQAATDFVEDFIMHLDEDEGRKWSTPMMVSMLVASWQEKKRQDDRRAQKALDNSRPSGTFSRQRQSMFREQRASLAARSISKQSSSSVLGVDTREVYRVALDLLLRRFQSRRQADRHKMKDTVQKFKELLVLIAKQMPEASKEFKEENVLPLLDKYEIDLQVWKDLSEAIQKGRVPLVQTKPDCKDSRAVRFVFTYGSFQRFLSRGCSPTRGIVRNIGQNSWHDGEPESGPLAGMDSLEAQPMAIAIEQEMARREVHDSLMPTLEQVLSPRRLSRHLVSQHNGLMWSLLSGWSCCFGQREHGLLDRLPMEALPFESTDSDGHKETAKGSEGSGSGNAKSS